MAPWSTWLLSLVSLGFYAHHCATCYPAQLIRRRIDSMEPVERMGRANPSIRWSARAYHWEWRWRRVTTRTKNGGTHTTWESYQVQVTRVAGRFFQDYGGRTRRRP